MSGMEVFILIECIVGIILIMVVIFMAAFLKRRRRKRLEAVKEAEKAAEAQKTEEVHYVLCDPYGFSAPATARQLNYIDARAKAFVEKQLREGRFYTR